MDLFLEFFTKEIISNVFFVVLSFFLVFVIKYIFKKDPHATVFDTDAFLKKKISRIRKKDDDDKISAHDDYHDDF